MKIIYQNRDTSETIPTETGLLSVRLRLHSDIFTVCVCLSYGRISNECWHYELIQFPTNGNGGIFMNVNGGTFYGSHSELLNTEDRTELNNVMLSSPML